jgi:aminopeptidase
MKSELTLNKAAIIALKEYMGLSQDESLLIVSDENLRNIGLTLFECGKNIAHEAFYLEMESRDRNGEEPPDQIASMMRKVDVVICPTTKSLTHTEARRRASDLGVRVGTMPGITEDIMTRLFSAEPKKIIQLSDLVAERLIKASIVKVTSKLGTDISFQVKKRRVITSTGVLRNIGEGGNLPSGEVFIAPWENKTNGIIIFDGSIAGIGLLKEPVTVEIKEGYIKKIHGGPEAELLIDLIESGGKNANAVAEFGIGTNYKAKITGNILEDEKVRGTIHLAFGNNMTMGGKINAKIHIDGIVKKPTFYFDDEMIMDNGKFLIEKD